MWFILHHWTLKFESIKMANFSPSATSIALSCIFTARQILSAIIKQHKGTYHSIGANIVTISKLKQLYLHSTSLFQMYSLPFKRHVLIDHDIQFIRSSLAANQNVWMLRVPLNSPQWECTHDAKVEQSMIFQRVQTKSQKLWQIFSLSLVFLSRHQEWICPLTVFVSSSNI